MSGTGRPGAPEPGRLERLRTAPAWVATLLATLTVFGPLSMDLYLPVLPDLADELGTTASAAQLTMTTCLLGLALGQAVAGPLSDRSGRRAPLLVGVVTYTAASVLCAAAPAIGALVAARLVQGMAGGVGLVVAQACGRDVYEGSRLSRFYGRVVVLSGLAAVVAPVLGGALASVVGWRGFFWLLAAVGAVVTAVVAVGFGETLPPGRRIGSGPGELLGQVGVLRRDRVFVGATAASALTSAAYFAYLAGAPFVLQRVYDLTPGRYALAFGANAAGFAAAGFLAGRASERWGERRVLAAGLGVMGAGAGALVACAAGTAPLGLALTAFFLVASGAATLSPPATTLALVAHAPRAGTASSVVGLARFAAGGVAAPLVGLGGQASMTALAVVVAASCAGGTVVFVWLVRDREPGTGAADPAEEAPARSR